MSSPIVCAETAASLSARRPSFGFCLFMARCDRRTDRCSVDSCHCTTASMHRVHALPSARVARTMPPTFIRNRYAIIRGGIVDRMIGSVGVDHRRARALSVSCGAVQSGASSTAPVRAAACPGFTAGGTPSRYCRAARNAVRTRAGRCVRRRQACRCRSDPNRIRLQRDFRIPPSPAL